MLQLSKLVGALNIETRMRLAPQPDCLHNVRHVAVTYHKYYSQALHGWRISINAIIM